MRNLFEMSRRWLRLNHSLKRFRSCSKRVAKVPPDAGDAPSFGFALTLEESVATELELTPMASVLPVDGKPEKLPDCVCA